MSTTMNLQRKEYMKQWRNFDGKGQKHQTVSAIWETGETDIFPEEGEIVIGIELSGTPLECRYNYVEKRWEAFDFQAANWFPVTLAYWTKCPI